MALSATPNTKFRATTSRSTGQIVRRAVFATGVRINPVMLATASTPDSASTIRTSDSQRAQGDVTPSTEVLTVAKPFPSRGTHSTAIRADATMAITAIARANRPAFRAPNQLINPISTIVTQQAGTTACASTPK